LQSRDQNLKDKKEKEKEEEEEIFSFC